MALLDAQTTSVTHTIDAIRLNYTTQLRPGVTIKRFTQAYLIYSEAVTLIDTGISGSERFIYQAVEACGRTPGDIRTIILTHAHPDHMGAAHSIQQDTGCRVMVHAYEKAFVDGTHSSQAYPVSPGLGHLISGPAQVDRQLQDNDTIALDDHTQIRVLHTPGHSIGSVSLLLSPERVLFTGDAFALAWGIPAYQDVRASVHSIKKLQQQCPLAIMLSAWDEPRETAEIEGVLARSLKVLQATHSAVRKHALGQRDIDPERLSKSVLADLNIPALARTSMVVKSIMAHLPLLDCEDLSTLS
jgi:hydroxyacylglutathione hydrolase